MKTNVLDKTGKEVKKIDLNSAVFGIEPNLEVIKQYIRVYQANQRQGTASTKNRAEVSGSGRKPWRQKGTGRARVGSIRSPLWRTGGIVHGPRPKSWNLKLPKRMKKLALLSTLSLKNNESKLIVVDNLSTKEVKTSFYNNMMQNLGLKSRTLFVLSENDLNTRKGLSNLKFAKTSLVDNMNPYEVLNAKQIVIEEAAIKKLEEKYANK